MDIEGDGLDELVVLSHAFFVVLEQDPMGGGLAVRQFMNIPSDLLRVATAGDVTGDGIADLVLGTWERLEVRVGSKAGLFDGFQGYLGAFEDGSKTPVIGDVNGDGLNDVVLAMDFVPAGAEDSVGHLGVMLQLEDGTLADPVPAFGPGEPSGGIYRALALGDLDQDGDLDLVYDGLSTSPITWLAGDGAGAFHAPAQLELDNFAYTAATGDLNGDGFPDVLVGGGFLSSGDLGVHLGAQGGTYQPGLDVPVPAALSDLAVHDFDGDGELDVLASSSHADEVYLLPGLGDGSFGPETTFPAGENPLDLELADFDGDGRLDASVCCITSEEVRWLLATGPDGALQPGGVVPLPGQPRNAAAADLDGDGDVDLAVVLQESDATVVLLTNDGSGGFTLTNSLPIPSLLADVDLADLDGDGLTDLAVGSDFTLRIWWGSSTGLGAVPQDIAYSRRIDAFEARDLDDDGRLDLVTTHSNPDELWIRVGTDVRGVYESKQGFGVSEDPHQELEFGDVDLDGRLDVLVPSSFGRHVLVLRTAIALP